MRRNRRPGFFAIWWCGAALVVQVIFSVTQYACSVGESTAVDLGPDTYYEDVDAGALEEGDPSRPGHLPPGYNQRHCQWDRCEPPPPNHLGPAVRPVSR